MGYRWPTMPRTGEAAVMQEVSRFAGGIGELGLVFHLQQAQVDYEAFKIEFEGEIDALGDRIARNQDENTYLAETKKVISATNGYMPKNSLAKRFASSFVNQRTPQLHDDAKRAMKFRVQSKWDAGLINETEKAIKTGALIDLTTYVTIGLINGSITEADAAKLMQETRNRAEYEAALNWSLTRPEELLENITIENGQIQLEGFVTLTKGQIIQMRANAVGTKHFNKTREAEAVSAGKGQISTIAWDAMVKGDYSTAQRAILSAPDEVGTAWKKAELTKLSEASKLLSKEGVNPYTERQDDAAYQRAIERALNKTLTIDEANEGVGGPWTISDGNALRKIINDGGTAKDFRDSDMAKTFTDILSLDPSLKPSLTPLAREQGLRWLEAWAKDNPDASQREADEQALRIYERVVREDIAGTLPTTAEELRALRLQAEAKTHRDFQQSIWEQLTKEERITALQARKQGKTPKEIIAFFEANK